MPAGLTGSFRYTVRLVAANHQVISIARSNPFLLVPTEPDDRLRDNAGVYEG